VLLHHPLDGQSAEADRRDCCSRGNLAPGRAPGPQSRRSSGRIRIWGSDWPHTDLFRPVPDDADLIECTYDWPPDDDIRYKVFVSNSNDLYFAH
jgi:hypothetical protein